MKKWLILFALALVTVLAWTRFFFASFSNEYILNRYNSFIENVFITRPDLYLLGYAYEKNGDYAKARERLEIVAGIPDELGRLAFHNIGSGYFYEAVKDTRNISGDLLTKAIESYEASLSIKHDDETQADLDAVRKLLNEVEKKQKEEQNKKDKEQKKQENWKGQSQSGSTDKTGDQSGSGGTAGTYSTQSRIEQAPGIEERKSLSPEEQDQLVTRGEALKELQKLKNQMTRPDGTKLEPQQSPSDLLKDLFRNDPLFGTPGMDGDGTDY